LVGLLVDSTTRMLDSDAAAQLADTLARCPLGTISPGEARDPTDILLVPRQGSAGSYWGADVTVDVALNAPRHRGSLTLTLQWPSARVGVELRGRSQNAFPVISGVYQGTVPGFTELDASATWRLPWAPNVALSFAALNVFDRVHREFVGAPLIGRLVVGRVPSGHLTRRPCVCRHRVERRQDGSKRMTIARVLTVLAALAVPGRPLLLAQVEVGEADLAIVRADAHRAVALLGQVWRAVSLDTAPVVAYSDSQSTACGVLGPENAFYCVHDDAIYYDAWFAAAVRAMVAQELESDGDHAVFAILAHEWGHRIYTRFRKGTAGIPVFAELTADCLAGAALREAGRAGSLAADDTAEVVLALQLLGDQPERRSARAPTFQSSWSARPAPGDPAAPGRFQSGLTRHGAGDERVRSFQRGFRQGAGKCMKELERR
jgi:hypothetical protein